MGIADKLTDNVQSWGMLAIIIVIISIILLKFKTSNVGNITCVAPKPFFNASTNLCCTGTDFTTATSCVGAGNVTAVGEVAGTLDSFIVALSEPKNWVAIVIIALIGFAMLKLFKKK